MEGNEHVFVQLVVTASSLLVCRLTSFRFRGGPRDAANLTSPRANPTYTLDSASPSERGETNLARRGQDGRGTSGRHVIAF